MDRPRSARPRVRSVERETRNPWAMGGESPRPKGRATPTRLSDELPPPASASQPAHRAALHGHPHARAAFIGRDRGQSRLELGESADLLEAVDQQIVIDGPQSREQSITAAPLAIPTATSTVRYLTVIRSAGGRPHAPSRSGVGRVIKWTIAASRHQRSRSWSESKLRRPEDELFRASPTVTAVAGHRAYSGASSRQSAGDMRAPDGGAPLILVWRRAPLVRAAPKADTGDRPDTPAATGTRTAQTRPAAERRPRGARFDQVGDQSRRPECEQERLVHGAEEDECPLSQPARRQWFGDRSGPRPRSCGSSPPRRASRWEGRAGWPGPPVIANIRGPPAEFKRINPKRLTGPTARCQLARSAKRPERCTTAPGADELRLKESAAAPIA